MTSRRIFLSVISGIFGIFIVGQLALGNPAEKVTRVESGKVCMVNDQIFPNELIPVKVGDKTYFGCCAMCKKTLSENESARMATDPVSRQPVDKALAVIGSLSNGRVLYFENESNLAAYNSN